MLFFTISCKNNLKSSAGQTPEAFTGSLLEVLKNKDENGLWNLFIQKEQLEEVMQFVIQNETERKNRVDEMWAAMNEDKGSMVRRFQRDGVGDFNQVKLDSVRTQIEPFSSFAGYESNQKTVLQPMLIRMYISQNGQAHYLGLRCMKFGDGSIRMVGYPES